MTRTRRGLVLATVVLAGGCLRPPSSAGVAEQPAVTNAVAPDDRGSLDVKGSSNDSRDAARDDARIPTADSASDAPPLLPPISSVPNNPSLAISEIPYLSGHRPRSASTVTTSQDDAIIAYWNRGGLDAALPTVVSRTGKEHPLHAPPRVRIDIAKPDAKTAVDDLERVTRSRGYWPARLCFETGLRRSQTLHGTISIRVDLDKQGKVTHAQQLQKDIADDEVASCLVHAWQGMVLVAPKRKTGRATITVELYPGDEPVYIRSAKSAIAHDDATAPFDPSKVRELLDVALPRLSACHALGTRLHPGLWGRLATELTVDDGGLVTDASESESHFPDPEVTRCVLDVLHAQKLPSAATTTKLVYPIRFGSFPESAKSLTSTDPHEHVKASRP